MLTGVMSGALQRITSEYVETEDRLRLSGALDEETTVVIWLTRRLLDRAVPHLIKWLGQQPEFIAPVPAGPNDMTPPVLARAEAQMWLVDRIDLSFGPAAITLDFFGPPSAQCSLVLDPLTLRQWLEILLRQYRQGEWPVDAWGEYIKTSHHDAAATVSLTLH